MNSIAYTLTVDDIVAFQQYYLENSPSHHRLVRRIRFIMILMVIAGFTLFVTFTPSLRAEFAHDKMSLVIAIVVLVISATGAVLLHPLIKRKISTPMTARMLRSRVSESKQPGLIGHHRLTLHDDYLEEESEIGKSSIKYNSILRIAEDPEHIYVLIGTMMAHVIPRRELTPEALETFVNALRLKLTDSQAQV